MRTSAKAAPKVAPNELTAIQAIRAIDDGLLTPRDVLEACLLRIAEREPLVQAWEHVQDATSLRNLDERLRGAPLRGLPVGIKDVIETADMPTTYGSPIYQGNRVPWDAACVALLRAAGAVMLGKTASTEFAMREPCRTRNPLDLDHSPGGSSSGSAAAVADHMVPVALGSQTTGSTIRPASYCGVYALKPSFGLINRAGLRPLSDSFDTVGIFARCIEDLYLVLSYAAGSGSRSLPGSERPEAPRVAFCRTPHWDLVEQPVQAQLEEAVVRLSAAGAIVSDFHLPGEFDGLDRSQQVAANFEIYRALSHEWLNHDPMLSGSLRARLAQSEAISRDEYLNAQAHLKWCRRLIGDLMQDFDCILAPSASGEAPKGLQSTGSPVLQMIWQGLRLPAVNIPALRGASGLPVGLQIIGRSMADEETLLHSEWIRRALHQ